MYRSEKNFLEKIADWIPGLKGYREKEDRRETDKRLRDFMASELDRHRRAIDAFKRDLLAKGRLDPLDEADRVVRKLQRAGDSIRFASYGYGGLFDQVKIREEELDRIYQYDGELMAAVKAFGDEAAALAAAADAEKALAQLESSADGLLERMEGRKQIFNLPA